MRRTISMIFGSCALAAGMAIVGCGNGPEQADRRENARLYTVDVVSVAQRPFRETLTATGSLLARESITLQAERAGLVKEIRFQEGRPVSAGDVLVVLDDSELRAQLARAQARLDLAQAVERRESELFRAGSIISEAEYEQNRANLEVARAEVELIEAQLAKTRVLAPFDGIPGLRQISAGAYLTPGVSICTFQDISALRLDFSLPERYMSYMRFGQQVRFRVASHAESFDATISAIEPGIDVATRSLRVRAVATNEEQRLLPGSFAEVEVVLDDIPDAILIPAIALVPGLKEQAVFVHRDGVVEWRVVHAGLRTADAVQVLAGLEPGDELVVSGILQLRPGMRVEVNRLDAETDGVDSPPVLSDRGRTEA